MQRLIVVFLTLATCACAGTVVQTCGSDAGDCGFPGGDYHWSFTLVSQFSVTAAAFGGASTRSWASVTLTADLTITVFGGTGHVLVIPCVSAGQSHSNSG